MILTSLEIDRAANLLKQGEIVAFPTETVYGLGAAVFNVKAVEKIFQAKGRPADNPLIVHIAQLDDVHKIAVDIPEEFWILAEAFFPGPLTLILPRHPHVPDIVLGGQNCVAVRMPNHPLALELIAKVGEPLVAPSANLSGRPSSTQASHVVDDFQNTIAAVLDGGATRIGIESTVLYLAEEPLLLRPGAVTKEQLEAVLKRSIKDGDGRVRAPGTQYRHYAPKAPLFLFKERQLLQNAINPQIRQKIELFPQAANLYAFLRQADQEEVDEILILCTPDVLKDSALMDRLQRAAKS